MKRKILVVIFSVLLLMLFVTQVVGRSGGDDTDTLIVEAKVVEVADSHISVMARSGVEHVIAVDRAGTKVTLGGRVVSLKDVREGDVVTVELDAKKPVKFAKNISMRSDEQVAGVRR